jgi:hypothetical protein
MSSKHRRNARSVTLATLASMGALLAFAAACGDSSAPEPSAAAVEDAIHASCTPDAPAVCTMPSARYAEVAPIFQKSCDPCHEDDAADGQWPLTQYDDVYPWASLVRQDLCSNAMPPADGGVPIAAADRLALLAWIQCGAPQ